MAHTFETDVTITGGSITGITDLTVADGGTGASTPAGARTNLEALKKAASSIDSAAVVFDGITGGLTRSSPTVVYHPVASNTEDKVEFGATFKDYRTATDGATVTFDFDLSDQWQVTFAGNRTLAFSNASVGQTVKILRYQDATGSRTPTWWSNIAWHNGLAPVEDPTPSGWSHTELICVGLDAYGVCLWKEVSSSTSAPRQGITTVTCAATTTFDLRKSSRQKTVLDRSPTLELQAGSFSTDQVVTLQLVQDATGGRAVTFGTSFGTITWTATGGVAPVMPTTANASCWLEFVCTNTTGPTFACTGAAGVNQFSLSTQGESAGTGYTATRYSANTSAPNFALRKARGTIAAPADAVAGDTACNFLAQAYDAGDFRTVANMAARCATGFGGGDSPGLLAIQTTPVGSYTQRDVVLFDSAGNVQLVVDGTLNAAAVDVVSFVGVDRINTRFAAAGNRVLAFQSERGSPIYLGADALDFAATTGVISVNGADLLSMTSTAVTLAGNMYAALSQNAETQISIANTTNDTAAVATVKTSAQNASGAYAVAFSAYASSYSAATLGADVPGNCVFYTSGLGTPGLKFAVRNASGTIGFYTNAGSAGIGTAKLALAIDASQNIQLVAAGTLNAAAVDVVSFVGVDRINTRHAAAGNRVLAFQSERGSPVYLGDDAIDFAATTGVISVNGADLLSMTSTVATLAGTLTLSAVTPLVSFKPTVNSQDCGLKVLNAAGSVAGYLSLIPNTIGTNSKFFMYVGGAAAGDIKMTVDDDGKAVFIGNVTMEGSAQRRLALAPSNFGYSANFRTLILGSSSAVYNTQDTGAVTLAFGVDVTANAGGSFTGDGSELLFRNVAYFITPNAGNTDFLKVMTFNNGNVGLGGIIAPTAVCHPGASTTARASLCLPHGSAPSAPVNGDMWTTTAGLFTRINGATNGVGDVAGPSSSVTGAAGVFSGTTGKLLRASPTVTYYSVSAGAEDKIEFGATFKDFRTATDGPTVTFDLDLSDQWQVTFAGNRTLAVSNASIGQRITILRYQDATGNRTPTWWSNITWNNGLAPVDDPTASGWSLTELSCEGLDAYSVPKWKEISRSTSAPRLGITTATYGATTTFDLRVSPKQTVTLSGNSTLALVSGSFYVGMLINLSIAFGGSYTPTWGIGTIRWPGDVNPGFTSTNGRVDEFLFKCVTDGGSPVFRCLGYAMNLLV